MKPTTFLSEMKSYIGVIVVHNNKILMTENVKFPWGFFPPFDLQDSNLTEYQNAVKVLFKQTKFNVPKNMEHIHYHVGNMITIYNQVINYTFTVYQADVKPITINRAATRLRDLNLNWYSKEEVAALCKLTEQIESPGVDSVLLDKPYGIDKMWCDVFKSPENKGVDLFKNIFEDSRSIVTVDNSISKTSIYLGTPPDNPSDVATNEKVAEITNYEKI
jgi:hypothetical protein